jgi:hypothetical protein
VRAPILIGALVLAAALGALTLAVIARNGLDPLTVLSLLLLGVIGIGLTGALREGDDDDPDL